MLTTEVENYPGFESIMGPELMQKMIDQSGKNGAEIIYKDVTKVDLSGRPFKVYTGEEVHQSKTVIISTGANAKMLGIPGESEFLGKGVSVCATCDGAFFKDQEIAVVGAGDSAMEEAIFLTKFASKVTILIRKDEGEEKASKVMLKRAKDNPKIEFMYNTEAKEVLGDQRVTGLKVFDNKTNEETELGVGALFIAIGYDPASELVKGEMTMDELGYLQPIHRTMSNIEGVFIAGDVEDNHYRQAVTAAGDGCRAAMDAEKWLAAEEGREENVPTWGKN
jgi:thioredoxin reductase (NADPH)